MKQPLLDGVPTSLSSQSSSPSSPWLLLPGRPPSQVVSFGRLILLWIASSICAGVIPGQGLFIDLFAEAGIFAGACGGNRSLCDEQYIALTDTFGSLQAIALIAYLPGGMLFDNFGGRVAGVTGGLLLAVGVVMVMVPLSAPDIGMAGPLFVAAVLIIDFGSLLGNQAFLGLVWHLPGWQALILALSNTCYQVSALLPVFFQIAMAAFGLSLVGAFAWYLVIVLLSTWVIFAVVPSRREYFEEAAKVLGLPMPRPKASLTNVYTRFRKACRVVGHDLHDHAKLLLPVSCGMTLQYVYNAGAAFGRALFGSQRAGEELVVMYSRLSGLIGFLMGPILGVLADSLGVKALAFSTVVSLVLVTAFFYVASWAAQAVAICGMSIYTNTFQLFVLRYTLFYMPPQHLGTGVGLLVTSVVSFYVVEIVLLSAWMDCLPDAGVDRWVTPTFDLGSVSVLAWVLVTCRMFFVPFPDTVVLLGEDEKELCKQFFVGCFEDAEEVLGMPRKEILRLLASSDVRAQRKLVKAISPERLLQVARRHDAALPPPPVPALPGSTEQRLWLEGGWLVNVDVPVLRAISAALASFNGLREGEGEPVLGQVLGPERSNPSDPLRRAVIEMMVALYAHSARRWGLVLSLCRGEAPLEPQCVCLAFPPGSLIGESAQPCPAGSSRFLHGIAQVGRPLPHLEREKYGMGLLQRWLAVESSAIYEGKAAALRRTSWYVAVLAVHPDHQGKGCAKRLLQNTVFRWADRDQAPCVLECGEVRVPLYERCGFREVQPRTVVHPEDMDSSPPIQLALMCRDPEQPKS